VHDVGNWVGIRCLKTPVGGTCRHSTPSIREGRYLWEIDKPLNMQPYSLQAHVVGDCVIGVENDDFGLWVVKRYRLVLPGEPDQARKRAANDR